MSVTITHHSEHHTITRDDARAGGAPDSATHLVYWLSDDAQSDMIVGWGSSADEAIMDAQRECSAHGIVGGSIMAYDIA